MALIKRRVLSYALVWTSFYDQLAWTAVLIMIAAAVGEPESLAYAASGYSVANLLGNLAFGLLADRVDRYRVAALGLVAMAGTGLLHLTITTPLMLVGVRFLHGLAIAAVAPAALAALSDGLPRNRRGEVMARVGLVIATASMLATSVTGRITTRLGTGASVLVLAGLVGVVGLASLLLRQRVEPAPPRMAEDPAEPAAMTMNPASIAGAALIAFALMFLQNVLFYAYPIKGRALGMSPATIGGTLAVFGLGSLIAFVPPLSRVADKVGRHQPLFSGMILAGVGLLGIAWGSTTGVLALCLLIYGLGFGLVFPAVSALNADAAGAGRRGFAFGLLTAAFSLGSISSPLLTQALSPWLSPFTVAGTLALVTGMLSFAWYVLSVRPAAQPMRPNL